MEERLLPVNAAAGLVLRNDVCRAILADAGFRLVGVEVPVVCRFDRIVTVDLVFFADEVSHLLLCEAKSGAHLDEEQAKKYSDIDPMNAVQASRVTLTQRVRPTVEVIYVCLERHVESLRRGFASAGVEYPLLVLGAEKLTLVGNELASDHLRRALRSGTVELGGPPPRLIPFDHDSDENAIEPFVKAQLVAELSNRRPSVSVPTLTERLAPYVAVYGRKARGVLIRKVGNVCRAIAASDPTIFSYQPSSPNGDGVVHLLRTPEANDPRGRTQAYQALARRPESRKRVPPPDPRQPDLFSELDVEDSEHGEHEADSGESVS